MIWDKVKIAMTFTDCLVDALVGTGFTGKLIGQMAQVVESMNKTNKVVIAIDMPSGVEADTGANFRRSSKGRSYHYFFPGQTRVIIISWGILCWRCNRSLILEFLECY